MAGPVVSMLPARNAEADLVEHLESVGRFADAVVALDDGSTDGTGALLAAHPLVHTLLTNPRRDGYAGWDDSANRNRLLDAAKALDPSWVMSLDADELIAADDAAALRRFLDDGADPDDAYLFPVLRMIGDLQHHDGSVMWAGRLFAPRPDHEFPADRLHFVPLPTAIPRDRWQRTTFRIQHRGSLTDAQRRARFAKYREADPDRRWQRSYGHLLHVPVQPRRWHPRGPQLPPLEHRPVPDQAGLAPGEPAFTVVVLAGADGHRHERVLDAVVGQQLDDAVEVVVVADDGGGPRPAPGDRRPAARGGPVPVRITVPATAGPGARRNAGLRAATGRHVVFVDDATELAPGHLAARLAAHRAGWPMVTGPRLNAASTAAGWADWFLAEIDVLPGRPSGPLGDPPPRCSFRRDVLEAVGGFPEEVDIDAEAVVAHELFARGYGAWHAQDSLAVHRGPTGPGRVLRARFTAGRTRGRLMAESRMTGAMTTRRTARSLVRSLPRELRRTSRSVERWGGDLRGRYRRVFPLVVAGGLVGWVGSASSLLARLRSARSPGSAGVDPVNRP